MACAISDKTSQLSRTRAPDSFEKAETSILALTHPYVTRGHLRETLSRMLADSLPRPQ